MSLAWEEQWAIRLNLMLSVGKHMHYPFIHMYVLQGHFNFSGGLKLKGTSSTLCWHINLDVDQITIIYNLLYRDVIGNEFGIALLRFVNLYYIDSSGNHITVYYCDDSHMACAGDYLQTRRLLYILVCWFESSNLATALTDSQSVGRWLVVMGLTNHNVLLWECV